MIKIAKCKNSQGVIFKYCKSFSNFPKAHELFLRHSIQTYSTQMIFDIEVVQKWRLMVFNLIYDSFLSQTTYLRRMSHEIILCLCVFQKVSCNPFYCLLLFQMQIINDIFIFSMKSSKIYFVAHISTLSNNFHGK